MRVWITCAGTSPEAVINSIWAACDVKGFIPDKIMLIHNAKNEKEVKKTIKQLSKILSSYNNSNPEFITKKIPEMNFEDIQSTIRTWIDKEKENNSEIAVDITPGRKFMSAIVMQAGIEAGIDHIYYLHLSDTSYLNEKYPRIPRTYQMLHDLTGLKCQK